MLKSTLGHRQFKKLCKQRESIGLTQREIAIKLSVPDSLISMFKSGVRKPTLINAVKIEELFGIPPRDWLK